MPKQYHQATKYTPTNLIDSSSSLKWGPQPDIYKTCPAAEKISLPVVAPDESMSVETAIEKAHVAGEFIKHTVSIEELSKILFYTAGITERESSGNISAALRAVPSAGALYPNELYLVVRDVASLKPGIYHYAVKDHALELIKDGDHAAELAAMAKPAALVATAAVTMIMSAVFHRVKWKYKERGYRYACLDAGHIIANMYLIATDLGYCIYPAATFCDDDVHALLGLDGVREAVLGICPIGKDPSPISREGAVSFASGGEGSSGFRRLPAGLSMSESMHEGGKIKTKEVLSLFSSACADIVPKQYEKKEKIALGPISMKARRSLTHVINERRSMREFSSATLTRKEFEQLLHYAYGLTADEINARMTPSIGRMYPLEVYVVVNNVDDLPRGIYHYSREKRELSVIEKGDYRIHLSKASLGQTFLASAGAVVMMTGMFSRVTCAGDRGYRSMLMDAGIVGEYLYLEAGSLGLRACGVAAFFDDEINTLLEVDGVDENILYAVAVGK